MKNKKIDGKLEEHADKCRDTDCLICLAWVRGANTWDEAKHEAGSLRQKMIIEERNPKQK